MWRFLRNRRLLLCVHTIFRALIYWAHRAVILAITWHLVSLCVCAWQDDADVSPCIGGDQFVDLSSAHFLQRSSTRRRKRALFFDFTAEPEHKWNTTIPYLYNITSVSIGLFVNCISIVTIVIIM